MRILIITDSYPPEVRSSSHLMKEMADGLKERNHEVVVVTSRPQHNVAGIAADFPVVSVEDGIPGLIFHVLHGFWSRFLVDAKIYENRIKKLLPQEYYE